MKGFIESYAEVIAKKHSICAGCNNEDGEIFAGDLVVKYYASTCRNGVTYHPNCWKCGKYTINNISEATEAVSKTAKCFRLEIMWCNLLQKNHIARMFNTSSIKWGFLGDKMVTDWYTNRNSASKLVKYAEAEGLKVKVILSSGEEIITDNFTAYKKFTDNF